MEFASSKELRLGSRYKLGYLLHAKTSIPLSGPTLTAILTLRQTFDLRPFNPRTSSVTEASTHLESIGSKLPSCSQDGDEL